MSTTSSQPVLISLPIPSPTASSDAAQKTTSTTHSTTSTTSTTPTTTSASTPTTTTSHPTTAPTTSSSTTALISSTSTTATSSTISSSQIVTTSNGQPVTIISYVVPSATPTSTTQNHTTSNSFFSNKSAVAGVFSVVGLIVAALVIALIINAIRRRRAQKFDRDVAEAAAEAAMSSRSPFDDYSYGNNGGNGGGGYGYSENSRGTTQQPPLPPHDNYGMSEMAQYDPYAVAPPVLAAAAVGGARSRNDIESGIAGVGARNLAREPSRHAPYHAFAGPGPQPHDHRSNTMRSRRGDVLEGAGLADTGAAAMAANNNYNNDAFLARKPSEYTQNTHHSGRSQGNGSMSNHPATLQPGYPVDSYYPSRNAAHSPESVVGYQPAQSALPNPHDAVLPSPSLPGHQSDHTFGDNEEYYDGGSPTALRSDEQRMSYQDDADYSQGNRVLRVANE